MAPTEEIMIVLRAEVEKARANLAKVRNDLKNNEKMFTKSGKLREAAARKIAKAQQRVGTSMTKVNKQLNKGKIAFAGWAMSIMFFGMFIQRLFQKIWTSSTKVFQDVAHSVEGTVTPLDMLNSQLDILKFTIGSALSDAIAPFLPKILELVETFLAWADENSELLGKIILLGGALGTLLFLFGTLTLAFNGFREAISLVGSSWDILTGLFSSGGGLVASLGLDSVLAFLGWIAVAIIAFVVLWKTNFGGFKDFIKTTLGNIWNFFKDTFNNIKSFLGNVFGFISSIFTGEWDKALGYLINAIIDIAKMIVDAFTMMITDIYNIWIFQWNLIISFMSTTLIGILSIAKRVASWLNIDASGISSAIDKVKSIQDSLSVDYASYEDNTMRKSANEFLDGLKDKVTNNIIINNASSDELNSEANREPFSA